MTMAIENQQRFGAGLSFDHIHYPNTGQFSNPWTSSSSTSPPIHNLYASNHHNLNPNLALDIKTQQPRRIAHNLSVPSYNNVPISGPPNSSSLDAYTPHHLLSSPPDLMPGSRSTSNGYESNYSTAPSPAHHSFSHNQAPYSTLAYNPAPVRSTYGLQAPHASPSQHPPPPTSQTSSEHNRRLSQSTVSSHLSVTSDEARRLHRLNSPIEFHEGSAPPTEPRPFEETIDSSRGMMTVNPSSNPSNNYTHTSRMRNPPDSYGYSSVINHSSSSSLSSTPATYPPYYHGPVDTNMDEYSSNSLPSNSSDLEANSSRTLPRPAANTLHSNNPGPGTLTSSTASVNSSMNNLHPKNSNSNININNNNAHSCNSNSVACEVNVNAPPAPQSMMSQFSCKVGTSTQKKHKCKVCDKRFTRPSSLQTHMYSHTGEKPFSCEVEGCGRQFSVVSNLRRHRKVHKGEARSETGSEEHHSSEL